MTTGSNLYMVLARLPPERFKVLGGVVSPSQGRRRGGSLLLVQNVYRPLQFYCPYLRHLTTVFSKWTAACK